MLDFKIRFVKEKPSLKDYNELFENIYDEKIDEKILEEAFNNTLEFVSVYDNISNELIGFSRIIGDKTVFLYIQDIMVKKEYQKQGIGGKIVEYTLDIIREYKKRNSDVRVYLGASKDMEAFYEKYGFLRRPNEFVGAGMILRQDFK